MDSSVWMQSFPLTVRKIPDDLDSVDPAETSTCYHTATRSDRKRVHVENSIFSRKLRSKDNKIINELTKKLYPTKGLDKVEDTTGRINYTTYDSGINNITITKRVEDRIGHFAHKNTNSHSNKSLFTSGTA